MEWAVQTIPFGGHSRAGGVQMAEGTRQAVLLSGMNTGEVFEVISAWRDTGRPAPPPPLSFSGAPLCSPNRSLVRGFR